MEMLCTFLSRFIRLTGVDIRENDKRCRIEDLKRQGFFPVGFLYEINVCFDPLDKSKTNQEIPALGTGFKVFASF